jgi:hypothetical protein
LNIHHFPAATNDVTKITGSSARVETRELLPALVKAHPIFFEAY